MTAKFLGGCSSALFATVLMMAVNATSVVAQETPAETTEEIPEEITEEVIEQTNEETSDTEVKSGSGRISVPLSGRGLINRNGNLSVTPNTLELDQVEIGESQTGTLTVTHVGGADAAGGRDSGGCALWSERQ